MIIEIETQMESTAIDLGATGAARIMQRVRTILSTAKGTVPLDRDFGVDARMLDKPLPAAKALLTAGIVAAIETYEPMVTVLSVYFKDDGMSGDGQLTPVVRLKIEETADVA
jgi:phage baseplate assembly protein W